MAGSAARAPRRPVAARRKQPAFSYFSRLRRAELGQHHHISCKYLLAYAVEMAWREDGRRLPNGALHQAATAAALAHPVSRQ